MSHQHRQSRGTPGCILPQGCSLAACTHGLTFTLPLLSLSLVPQCPAASFPPAFEPSRQPSCSPVSECLQPAPCCLLPISAHRPLVPAYPVSDTRGVLAGSHTVTAGGGDRWGRRQSLLCSMAHFGAAFDSLSGREADKVMAALSGTRASIWCAEGTGGLAPRSWLCHHVSWKGQV